jgi:uncharacterized membrane protein
MLAFKVVIKIDNDELIKKWIPIVIVVSISVLIIGIIFGRSFPQIISSIAVSILLILSAMFFKSVGRNRESEKNNSDGYNFDNKG